MKNFTVNIGGQSMTMPGPDNATQEQAQTEAERQFKAKQAADVNRDFQGPGHVLANIAQGGAELFGGPAQLLGATPGPRYQQAENEPTTTGDKAARFAGAALPLAPLGAAGAGGATKGVITQFPDVAEFLASKGILAPATAVSRSTIPGMAAVAPTVGAVEGASAPADSQTQRVINTGFGALTGGLGRGVGSSSLDRLAGALAGGWMGHGLGGWIPALIGGNLGSAVGPEAHHAVTNLLRQIPPSVLSRALTSLGYPVSKSLAEQGDYWSEKSSRGQSPPPQQ